MFKKSSVLKVLPIFIQNIIISTYGYFLIKQRYRSDYYQQLNRLLNSDDTNKNDLLAEQNRLLDDFIRYAIDKSPYYQALYKDIDLTQKFTVENIAKLPIVSKEMLRENLYSVYAIPIREGIKSFTGGTTGKSLQVLFTSTDMQQRMAQLDAFKMKVGIDPFALRKATFSGREFTRGWASEFSKVFWRKNWSYKQRLYSTFDMTDKNLTYYVKDLNNFKPQVINGFVSAIYQLAKFIQTEQLAINFKVDAIFTTSETLLPFQRALIEKIFSCNIYNQYASAEGAPFITECKARSLHYQLNSGVIEEFKTPIGTEMLVTSFTTHGTPLIRYKIGDLIKFKEGRCACGSEHPLVHSIEGRKVEYLYSIEYGKISLSHLADVIKGLPNCIKSVQFQQHDLQQVNVILSVDSEAYDDKAERKILSALKYRFGEKTHFTFKLVDNIPKEKSGKFALIKNFIKFPESSQNI